MFFVGNKKFEKLEHVYEFLKSVLDKYYKGEKPNLVIYYNNEIIYNSSIEEDKNPMFYISKGVKANLLGVFLLKYKGVNGTLKYKDEILWQF